MCGIAGIINYCKEDKVSGELLNIVTDSLSHRGPDSRGTYVKNNVGLGFRRLSIIDLSESGNQPLKNEDNTVIAVCNGEIYNYIEIREDLRKRGHFFSSNTDSEIIVHAYEEYGELFVDHIKGMFAFCIYDNKRNKVILGRDRLGIKPLYYLKSTRGMCFASELKSLLKSKYIEPQISKLALNLFLTTEVVPAPYTIFKDCYKLEAGCIMVIDLNLQQSKVKRYWDVEFNTDYSKSENEWLESIESKLKDSVDQHLLSDVAVSTFLSGGIDSSLITGLVAKSLNKPFNTYTIGFNTKKEDERPYAREVAELNKTLHNEKVVDIESLNIIDKLVESYDEPYGDSSAIPTYYVCEMAAEKNKVVLSGDGGDELFGGYFSLDSQKKIVKATSFLKNGYPKIFRHVISNLLPMNIKQAALRRSLPNWSMLATLHSHIFDDNRLNLINPDWRCSWDEILATFEPLKRGMKDLEPMNALFYAYYKTYLPDDILTKVDRVSNAHSLEVRIPFLDHELVEEANKIPVEIKIRNNESKYLLKKVAKKYVPETVLNHRKQGFSVPIENWSKTIWKNELLKQVGLDNRINQYVDMNSIKNYNDSTVWCMLFFSKFLKNL